MLCWQAGNAAGGFVAATIIQSLILVYNPDYSYPNWQGTLLVIPVMFTCLAVNVWGTRIFPILQNVIMVIHMFGFVAVIVVLWVLAPHVDASTAIFEFTNLGGWSSMGLALMVGQLTNVFALGGKHLDTAASRLTLITHKLPTPPLTWPKKSAMLAFRYQGQFSGHLSSMALWASYLQ